MALSWAIDCSCGRCFHVYLPKQKIFGEILGDTSKNWEEIDREEIEAGELELSKARARMEGVELIELPETGRIECPCGEVFDVAEMFQTATNSSGVVHYTQ